MDIALKENIPTVRKVDLVTLTVQEALYNGMVNPMLLKIYFEVNMILVYSTFKASDADRADKLAFYDTLKKEGVTETFIELMNDAYPGEIGEMWDHVLDWSAEYTAYQNSFIGVLDNIKMFLATLSDELNFNMDALKEVDLGKLAEVIPLADALGKKPE